MPELPEVETIVKDLNKTVKGLKITDVWTDWEKMIKTPPYNEFVKQIKGRKILKTRRRAKYILIDLSGGKTLMIHQKISGHLLCGRWEVKGKKIKSLSNGPLKEDPQNRFIRFILYLNNKKQLGLSDLRRFGKALLVDTNKLSQLKEIEDLGPEPLDKKFTFNKFQEILRKRRGRIKQVLMKQNIIAGIGNIYSDEILFDAKINPLKKVEDIKKEELKKIYQSMKKILQRAIVLRGDSMSDYRDLSGKKGRYQEIQKVYQREGEKCYRCKSKIKRIKIGGRSAHFCPICQKQ